jgi:hypothetical protein
VSILDDVDQLTGLGSESPDFAVGPP